MEPDEYDDNDLERALEHLEAIAEIDEKHLSDLKLALDLFEGTAEIDENGLPRQRYLDRDEENTARQALGRLLRNSHPLDNRLRILLAGHFDGETVKYQMWPRPEVREIAVQRRLEFINPGKQPLQDRRRLQLAWKVAHRLKHSNESVEAAIAAVAEEHGFTDDKSVWIAWAEFKDDVFLRRPKRVDQRRPKRVDQKRRRE
jgi:hypothetical protein